MHSHSPDAPRLSAGLHRGNAEPEQLGVRILHQAPITDPWHRARMLPEQPACHHSTFDDAGVAPCSGTYQRQVDIYFALSELARRKFVEGGLPEGRIVVKPNFVSSDPGAGEGHGGYALFASRLSEEKA